MSTVEDFKNAPIGATATLGDGTRVMKMGDLYRRWMTPSGFYMSDEQVWGREFTLDPLPEPLYPNEKEKKNEHN